MALEQELETFKHLKDDLLKVHPNKFALIKGDQLIGTYDNPENAYTEGVARFGKDIFLVKRISETEEVYRNQALFSGLVHAHF